MSLKFLSNLQDLLTQYGRELAAVHPPGAANLPPGTLPTDSLIPGTSSSIGPSHSLVGAQGNRHIARTRRGQQKTWPAADFEHKSRSKQSSATKNEGPLKTEKDTAENVGSDPCVFTENAECVNAQCSNEDRSAMCNGTVPIGQSASQYEYPINLAEIAEAYKQACQQMKVTPSEKVLTQIRKLHTEPAHERQASLSLKAEKITCAHMEAFEEIFRRVQFDSLEFEYSYLDDESLVALCEMLEFYDSAVRLNISFNQKIGLRGWAALFRLIKNSDTLSELDLRYTSLSHRVVPMLARTIRFQPVLRVLHLENCALSSQSLLLLVCAAKTSMRLQQLYLGENNLSASDAAHIHSLIKGNCSLELLDLRHNNLQDAGLAHICDALRDAEVCRSSRLHTLVLWNNKFTPGGMVHVARALSRNSVLETLNLGCNNVTSAGLDFMKESLARSRSLKRLGLQACRLNCQAAIALAEVIAESHSLRRIDIRDNPDIRSAGLLALYLAVKMNTTLTALNLDPTACATSSKTRDLGTEFRAYYDSIQAVCDANRLNQGSATAPQSSGSAGTGTDSGSSSRLPSTSSDRGADCEGGAQTHGWTSDSEGEQSPTSKEQPLSLCLDTPEGSPRTTASNRSSALLRSTPAVPSPGQSAGDHQDSAHSANKAAGVYRQRASLSLTCAEAVGDLKGRIRAVPQEVVGHAVTAVESVRHLAHDGDTMMSQLQQHLHQLHVQSAANFGQRRRRDALSRGEGEGAYEELSLSVQDVDGAVDDGIDAELLDMDDDVLVQPTGVVELLCEVSDAVPDDPKPSNNDRTYQNGTNDVVEAQSEHKSETRHIYVRPKLAPCQVSNPKPLRMRRFSVTKVCENDTVVQRNAKSAPTSPTTNASSGTDYPKKTTENQNPSTVIRRPSELQMSPLPDIGARDSVDKSVTRLVNDLVTFCAYEIGDDALLTPSVPRGGVLARKWRKESLDGAGAMEFLALQPKRLAFDGDASMEMAESDEQRTLAVRTTVRSLVKQVILHEQREAKSAMKKPISIENSPDKVTSNSGGNGQINEKVTSVSAPVSSGHPHKNKHRKRHHHKKR